jgi:hypothetical protein
MFRGNVWKSEEVMEIPQKLKYFFDGRRNGTAESRKEMDQ